MKSINKNIFSLLLCSMFLFGFTLTASAQAEAPKGDKTYTMKVPGVCGMCKERIETTAMDVKGVKKAEWDVQTDTLVLVGSEKMDPQKVADALAKAGYGSDLAKADPKGYSKLPGCCQYNDVEKH